ncbi:hypothetical protein L6164_013673 [Bauhinia variegata]|uniref:Uncharacterized protein n=1 Tax=Bauhinia variegata TaxID=167791 RepID=A0ACB9NGB3_BAUVA|nr:hypothetical protein L6164_013673 [Bauhinia variegata]
MTPSFKIPFRKEILLGYRHIRKGIYREKVHIPKNKPYIFMRGNGKGRTIIVWSKSSSDNVASAIFRHETHDFIAFGISFKGLLILRKINQ